MYDFPEVAGATDALWAEIRDRLRATGVAAPETLDRGRDIWAGWRDPALVLSQTCSLPYRTVLNPHVTLIGTPDHALPNCPPGYYRSVIVARPGARIPDDWAGLRLAVNDARSQSGWGAIAARAAKVENAVLTGGHRASVAAVANETADLCAVDAQSWRLMQDHGADAGLVEIERTAPTPGLPLIAAAGADAAVTARAVDEAIDDLAPDHRAALHLRGLVRIPAAAYLALPVPPPLPQRAI